jgi:hypothetical protein
MDRRQFLSGIAAVPGFGRAAAFTGSKIRHVDIVHHTHLDVGYTALPSVVRQDQVRYLDAAIDCCQADPQFRWTVETLVELDDWWRASTPARHKLLQDLIAAGHMDVMGMPFNQTPFLNAAQWRTMMDWIPRAVWDSLHIRAAMQNDVNGLPRAGAMALLDRGIHHLLMGINADNGGPPFTRPAAFWWKQPDGRRLFVWLGEHYGSLSYYLAPARKELRYDTSEAAVRAAHMKFTEHMQAIEAGGYAFDRLILTHTHPQHWDNGYPYPSLAPFIAAWNRLKLEPVLRLTTATDAILAMEKVAGAKAPVESGEWTDWWAGGDASAPREVAASRIAKRSVAAASAALFGPMPAAGRTAVRGILRDLCLFDEHTWGADNSVTEPWSLNTQAQWGQKADLAYRPMGEAEALLLRRIRAKIDLLPAGVYALNPAPAEVSGWVALKGLDAACRSLVDPKTGEAVEVVREGKNARCWVEKLAANSLRAYRTETTTAAPSPSGGRPTVRTGVGGWPVAARWAGMPQPLFDGACGDFVAVGLVPPADRRSLLNLHRKFDPATRQAMLRQTEATYGVTATVETPHTLRYTQDVVHPHLGPSRRTMELWRREPRARITVTLDRLSSMLPELLFLSFDLPHDVPLPVFASGGVPFTPYRDQLRGSCRDYFGIDGWAHYATSGGHWLWVTRDAPLVAIGGTHVAERHQEEPANPRRILARVFENIWHTNFVADSHGLMEFQFDLVWRPSMEKPAALAEALAAGPLVAVSAAAKEETPILNRVYRP